MRRQQAQANNNRVLERLEIIVIETSVDNKEEDGRHLGGLVHGVLDGGVLGQQLSGQVGGTDVFVVGREVVAVETEGTDPELLLDVDLAVGLYNTTQPRMSLRVELQSK